MAPCRPSLINDAPRLVPSPLAGGTLLTITGRGFPDTSAPLLNNVVNITIKGQPCTVVSSNYTTVLCSTPAQGTLVQPTVTLANGTVVYPVSDGIDSIGCTDGTLA